MVVRPAVTVSEEHRPSVLRPRDVRDVAELHGRRSRCGSAERSEPVAEPIPDREDELPQQLSPASLKRKQRLAQSLAQMGAAAAGTLAAAAAVFVC